MVVGLLSDLNILAVVLFYQQLMPGVAHDIERVNRMHLLKLLADAVERPW